MKKITVTYKIRISKYWATIIVQLLKERLVNLYSFKQLKPSLNVREKLIKLHIYNSPLIYDPTRLKFQILIKHYLLVLTCKKHGSYFT